MAGIDGYREIIDNQIDGVRGAQWPWEVICHINRETVMLHSSHPEEVITAILCVLIIHVLDVSLSLLTKTVLVIIQCDVCIVASNSIREINIILLKTSTIGKLEWLRLLST